MTTRTTGCSGNEVPSLSAHACAISSIAVRPEPDRAHRSSSSSSASSSVDAVAGSAATVPGRSTLSEGAPADAPGARAADSVFARWAGVAAPEAPADDADQEHEEHEEPVADPEVLAELDDASDDSASELPVDASTRAPLPHREHVEQMFGTSFSGVQAHVGADLTALGAQAAAAGTSVAFADAQPSRELVAHEMTHVMQQRNASSAARGVAPADSPAEREADANEARAASGERVAARATPAGAVHLKRAYAPTDRYNKKQHAGRPSVAVGRQQTFRVRADTQRYSFVAGAGVRAFDVVTQADAITVNIAQPRVLTLPDRRHHTCVLARTRLGGSAWLPLDALDVDGDKLVKAARHLAGRDAPAAPRGRLKERVFKAATRATDLALTPHRAAQTRAQYDHYLHRTSNAEVQDGFYNVCMALPQHGKVPTAIDVARPGNHFFVMQTREVPLYENGGAKRPVRHARWAFGCMGKQDGAGDWQPDRSRRGWVPLEALT